MFGSSLPPVNCKRVHVLFTLLCLFTYSNIQDILYYIFVLFVFVLCTLCCQFLCVVFCLSSYCVPYVASFSVLCFVCLRIVYPMLPVSLCCVLFVFVLCTLCCQFLCVVCCLSSYCVPYVASFSGLSFRYSLTFIYILTGSSF